MRVRELIDLYMAYYAGRDPTRVQRLGWWSRRIGELELQALSDDEVHAAFEELARQRSRYFAGPDVDRNRAFDERLKSIDGCLQVIAVCAVIIIQAVFGWSGGHLHEFNVGDERFGTPDPEYDEPGSVRNERATRLANALGSARTMNYLYDFGDNRQHRIKVEKTLVPDPGLELPLCIAGANATPPDDCGGVYGYYDFVAAVSDPTQPEHAEMCHSTPPRRCWLDERAVRQSREHGRRLPAGAFA